MKLNESKKFNILTAGRPAIVLIILTALLLWGLILNVNTGSVNISAGNIVSMLVKATGYGIANIFTGGGFIAELKELLSSTTESQILFSIRMPRMLLAVILGGALSVSGFLLQTFFRNPIAGPFVLGISSGAKMVVSITMIFLLPYIGNIVPGTMIAAAFIGSLVITTVILTVSGRVKNMSMLLVVGVMVGYICSAVTDFIITFASEQDIVNLTSWSMGTFSGASWGDVRASAVLSFPAVIAAWLLSKPIGAYALGEGYAKSMGIRIKPFRIMLILLSSLLSACVTALAGPISFVGIAVPHITRTLLKSSAPSVVIPTTFVCGGVFCVFCDLIARTVFSPTELAIGTVTSIFGAPIVIYILIKRRKAGEN